MILVEFLNPLLQWFANNLLELVNVLLVGFGVWVAKRGLSTWSDQLKGKNQYQLATDILEVVYDLEERLKYARVRLYTIDVSPDSESQKDQKYKAHAERVGHMLEANNKLRVLKFRADAIWSKETNVDVSTILELINNFTNDFGLFYEMGWDDPNRRKDDQTADEVWITLHGTFRSGTHDSFQEKFQTSVLSLEKRMRSIIDK